MDMLHLKTFLSVSRNLSFTKTAEELYVSQPTVSNYIKSLESSVGFKLVNRGSRTVSLTIEGKEFVGYANKLLTVLMEAENRIHNMSIGRSGYIRIAILSSSTELFSRCLSQFKREQPRIQINVDIKEGIDMMRAIDAAAYDIYFANRYMIPESNNIEYKVIGSEKLHLFMHREVTDKIEANDWEKISTYDFVSVPETDFALTRQIRTVCRNRGFTPDIINYYNRADTLLMAVNASIGLAILPQSLNYFFNFPNVVSMPIEGDDAVISSVIAWHKNKTNPDTERFLSLSTLSG